MRALLHFVLVLAICKTTSAFVVPPVHPPSLLDARANQQTTTELDLFRKDGKVRSSVRRARGFIKQKIFRRAPELTMNDASSQVIDGVPVPVVILAEKKEEESTAVEENDKQAKTQETKVKVVEEETDIEKEFNAAMAAKSTTVAPSQRDEKPLKLSGTSYTEKTTKNLLEARLAMNSELASSPTNEEAMNDEAESSTPSSNSDGTIQQQVDDYFAAGKPLLAMGVLQEAGLSQNGALYWRYVKAHYELYAQTFDQTKQQQYLEQGLELIDNAPKEFWQSNTDSNNNDSHTQAMLLKWKAILLGKLGSFQSTRDKMANSFLIKESLEQAQSLLQNDASIYQALGEWSFKVAGISFLERQVAGALFGTPPEATYDDALKYFQNAFDLKPSPVLATKVSETYVKLNNKAIAQDWAEEATKLEMQQAHAQPNEIVLP